MSTVGPLLIPALEAITRATQLREAIHLFPLPPTRRRTEDDDARDPYRTALRDETGSLAGLLGTLAITAATMHQGAQIAHHAMRRSSELRMRGWSLEERRAVDPIRANLAAALRDLDRATTALVRAEHAALELVDQLHPIDSTTVDA